MRSDATAPPAGSTSARLGALLALASAFLLVAFAPAAFAAPKASPIYFAAGSFGSPGSGPGQFSSPRRIAVEPPIPAQGLEPELSGNVLVTDSGNARIEVFAPEPLGTYLTSITTAGTPYGIAIDQTNGDVYVSEHGAANQIVRYQSDGAPTPTYTLDPSFVSPVLGSGAGQIGSFASPIAVDPTTHDLLVGDTGNLRVSRYTATGSFVGSFDGEGAEGGVFTGLLDLAVDASGDIYVLNGMPEPYYGTGPYYDVRVIRFAESGVAKESLSAPSFEGAQSVAVDPDSGNVIIATGGLPLAHPELALHFFQGGAQVLSVPFPSASEKSGAIGLAVDTGPSGRIFALTDSQQSECCGQVGVAGVQAFDPSAIPGVEVQPVSDITPTSVRLHGAVDPGGQATSAHFEYSGDGGASWAETPDQVLGSETGVQPVEADVVELAPNSEYLVRLEAANPDGFSAVSEIQAFSTAQAPPAVVTGTASHIAATQATLNGKINSFGLQTTYGFQYGETTAYGNTVPLAADGIAGNGHALRAFSRVAFGLSPGTTYHFRLVARNAIGTTAGEDQTFTTRPGSGSEVSCPNEALRTGFSAALPECRAYEQVTPVDKNGAIIAELYGFQSTPDGDGIGFTTRNPSSDVETSVRFNRFATVRSANGWSTRSADPPTRSEFHGFAIYISQVTIALSQDVSKAIVVSPRVLAPGAVEDNANLYVRDIRAGTYAFVGTSSEPLAYASFAGYNGAGEVTGGASDFSWIVFTSQFPLLPEATYNQAYRWSQAGGLELVSRLPGGAPSGSSAHMSQEAFPRLPVTRFASDDGKEIAFSLEEADAGAYLWREGSVTALSVSQVEGGPPGPQAAVVTGMSRDGRYVTFVVHNGVPLTTDAPAGGTGLYRFDVVDEQLEYLGASFYGANEALQGVPAVSQDGNHVYFQDFNALSVWSQGTAREIAPVRVAGLTGEGVSPDGRYFAYEHADEVYLYDAAEDKLTCASCPTDGSKSLGAHLPEGEVNPGQTWPQVVTDRGQVFFNTVTPLVPRDVNGTQDVYMFDHGDLQLISPGSDNFRAYFAGISADGANAFFFSGQPIVAQDRDGGATDVYDARVNGGIAAQNTEPTSPCAGDNCRGPASPPPPPVAVRSESTTGPGNLTGRQKKCGKRQGKKSKAKGRCAKHRKHHAKRRHAR